MSEKPSVPATLQTLLLICETDQQREELTHCYYATLGGDPSSPILQLATLISAMAAAGRKNNANGELSAHLADLKKSEALKASQAPEIRKCLEQLNATQGDILKRLRTLPASPAGGDTWGKRLAWQVGIGLGLLLLGFLAGSLRSARQANARVDAVIGAMPTAARASLYLESHGGSISLGPINEADGTRRQGVIVVPGGLHLDTPWTSTDGATVIPIR